MAPDNWEFCPNCVDDEKNTLVKELKELNDSYGEVPAEEFIENHKTASDALDNVKRITSLAEYTDIGMSVDGYLMISYKASCERCGIYYKYEQKIKLEGEIR